MIIKRRKIFAAPEGNKKTPLGQPATPKNMGLIKELKPSNPPEYMKHELPDPNTEGREFLTAANSELGKL